MEAPRHILSGVPRRLSLDWLLLGLSALFASHLFAVVLILLRTTGFSHWFHDFSFFNTALALHVTLSVLVWFLSFAGTLWSLAGGERWASVGRMAWFLGATGTTLILFSPWLGTGHAVMSNYLPVLHNPVFLVGLALFGLGTLLLTLRACVTLWPFSSGATIQFGRLGLFVAAIPLLLVFLAFLHAAWYLFPERAMTGFYETLFWGGGHLLQFLHTFLMLVMWLWLIDLSGIPLTGKGRTLGFWFVFGLLPVVSAPFFFLGMHPQDPEYRHYFTQLMTYGSWLACPAIGFAVIRQWFRRENSDAITPEQRFFLSTLLFSIFLFTMGLVIGSRIEGDSVIVTAHYHGTVGAITLAYMGVTFHVLSLVGYRQAMCRLRQVQPYVYGGGLSLLILGLTWLGFQGAPRKTPLTALAPATWHETFGLLLLGLGGFIGLLGGGLFLFLTFRILRTQERKQT